MKLGRGSEEPAGGHLPKVSLYQVRKPKAEKINKLLF
jgi:hypothetical protein